MPVKDRNPFGPSAPEEGKADLGVPDPFTVTPSQVVSCPVCSELVPEKISTTNIGGMVHRTCQTCGNKWQGGGGIDFRQERQAPPPDGDLDLDVPPDPRLGGIWSND